MRCAAGAGLLVLVGCNQVFGIHKAEPYDAGPDVIPDIASVQLAWRVADVVPTGGPAAAAIDLPITSAVTVRYAKLREPWIDGTYDRGTIVVDHAFVEPVGGKLPTWRLEYTIGGGVPHEVQWAPEPDQGHLVVPRYGQDNRVPPPATAGYDINLPGVDQVAEPLTIPRVFTTGVWSEGRPTTFTKGSLVYGFDHAVAMSDRVLGPAKALGDQAFVIDYANDADGCRLARGSARIADPDPRMTGHAMTDEVWDASKRSFSSTTFVQLSPEAMRFNRTITTPLDGRDLLGTFVFGYAASTALPGLPGVPSVPSLLPVSTVLPAPVMIPIAVCPYASPTAVPIDKVANQPKGLAAFSPILHVELYTTRTVDGIELASGMESVTPGSAFTGFAPTLPAAVPLGIALETSAGTVDLIAGPDGSATVPAGPATLKLTPEVLPGVGVDYYDVIVHRVMAANSALTTERIYTVIAPTVELDPAALPVGFDYILEVRTFRGHPEVSHGDFRQVAYPYGSAVVFSRKFRVN